MQCKYTWLPMVNLPGYMAPNYPTVRVPSIIDKHVCMA